MNLKNIHAFDACFDIEVKRLDNGKLEVLVKNDAKTKKFVVKDGQTLSIKL